jgi:hypothetical protein
MVGPRDGDGAAVLWQDSNVGYGVFIKFKVGVNPTTRSHVGTQQPTARPGRADGM